MSDSHTLVLITSESTLLEFDLEACPDLRVFEVRIETPSYAFANLMNWLARALSSVKSPVFSKFILSLDDTALEPYPFQVTPATTDTLDRWVSWLFSRSGMRFIIKGDLSLVWRQVLVYCFPRSRDAGAIMFDFPDPGTVPQCSRGR